MFIRDKDLERSDLTTKLENAFLAGLRCNQPHIRQKFLEVSEHWRLIWNVHCQYLLDFRNQIVWYLFSFFKTFRLATIFPNPYRLYRFYWTIVKFSSYNFVLAAKIFTLKPLFSASFQEISHGIIIPYVIHQVKNIVK